jgi:hypothetical protein
MKTFLVYSLFLSALAIPTTIVTGGSCTITDHHPDNDGYHIIGVNGYKSIHAKEDPDDITKYGDWGQKADDYLWTSNQSLATYPKAEQTACAKGLSESCSYPNYPVSYEYVCVQTRASESVCRSETDEHEWRKIQTCSIMRFAFAEDSGSTVFRMTNNATFQACDFTDAEEITDGGQLPSGASFRDYVFEDSSLDGTFYFASQSGCEEGQKIAVKVLDLYDTKHDPAKTAGALGVHGRIQHCDCDHAINPSSSMTEAAHAGFIEGCKTEMPLDLSCCPGPDVEHARTSFDVNFYDNGGNCMRRSDEPGMIAIARELYKFCSIAENEATCDKYKTGDCPYWRVYLGSGYAYNSMVDGLEGCTCTPDSDGNLPPHCRKSLEYGPRSGYLHRRDCASCYEMYGGKGTLAYNGRTNRMPDIPENYGCDGANSTYNVKCDMWYVYTNCKDLYEDGKNLTVPDEAINPHFANEITKEICDSSQWFAAMEKYLASPEYLVDFPPPTAAPTPAPATPAPTSAAPTPTPTAAPDASKTTAAPTAVESNCRLEAMAALTVWLISVLQ